MATAEKVLAWARAQLGTKERPANSNNVRYNTAYYGRPVSGGAYPWCCAFVWCAFQECGAPGLFFGGQKTASCTTLYNFYRSQGRIVPVVQARPGDLVFFVFDGNKTGTMNHIGICESCSSGYITTIDGNTGTNNEANGGAVMRRKRALSYVGGVARPNYEEEINLTGGEVNKIMQELVERELSERDAAAAQAVQKVSPWAAKSWERATGKGVLDGTRPGGTLTREQAAVIFDRLGLLD